MKFWQKVIIGIILGLILIVALWPWLENIFGSEVDVSYLENQKEKLMMYYSCSLAMCTKGCGDNILEDICLENTTGQNPCDYSCKDLCNDKWPAKASSGPGEVCGPAYNLDISLEKEVWFEGCWKVEKIYKPSLAPPFFPNYWKYIYYTFVQNKSIVLYEKTGFPVLRPHIVGDRCLHQELGLDIYEFVPGIILSESDVEDKYFLWVKTATTRGIGAIRVNDRDANEKWGCIKKDCGYEGCNFYGDLKIWTINPRDCGGGQFAADVIFNSTLVKSWWFDIRASPFSQTIKPGDSAEYTITIDNRLGVDTDFDLSHFISQPNDPVCVISPDTLSVQDESSEESTMTCTPSESGEYAITIRAKPRAGGIQSHYTYVKLRVMDFYLDVKPNLKFTGLSTPTQFKVKVWNYFGSPDTFTLSSSDSDCSISPSTLNVDHGSSEESTMTCTKDTEGTYFITVSGSSSGITKTDATSLIVGECWDRS